MAWASSGGDPHDTGFVAVPLTVVGGIVAFLSAVIGGGVIVAIGAGGGGVSWTAVWLTVAFVGLGVALIGWDRLTDHFESTRPGAGWTEEDEPPVDDGREFEP